MSTIKFTEGLEFSNLKMDKTMLNQAEKTFNSASLPTTRDEAWKYTRVAKINNRTFKSESSLMTSVTPFVIDENAFTIVFLNGEYRAELSSRLKMNNVTIASLSNSSEVIKSELNQENEIFNAINTLFLTDGASIKIDKNAQIETPIQIIHIMDGDSIISNFKIVIDAGDNSRSEIILGYFSSDDSLNSFANVTTEIKVGKNAHLSIDKIQVENESSFHINSELVSQEKDSTFNINTITLNGLLVRNNLTIEVNGQNCTTNLNGAYLLKDNQHVDNHTIVDHKVAHCNSNELYKGVIDGKGTAVFNGKVFVRPDAQKINAFQSNGNVLLSDDAAINSKPELEIYADDVKCSHGSTTGQLDENAIFYLRARGLSEDSARKLLVQAFINDVLEKIESEVVRSFVDKKIEERFKWVN